MSKVIKKTVTTTTEKFNDRGSLIERKTQVVEKDYETNQQQQVIIQREPLFMEELRYRAPIQEIDFGPGVYRLGEPLIR